MTLPPGRELDALIAEKVMGLRVTWEDSQENDDEYDVYILNEDDTYRWTNLVPHYSTDLSAAWEVVEKLVIIWPQFALLYEEASSHWMAASDPDIGACAYAVGAPTAPHAICLAALEAPIGS